MQGISGVEVGNGVEVGSGVEVGGGVEVGVSVGVEVGVNVGPNNCPGAQPEKSRLIAKIHTAIALLLAFIAFPALSRAHPAAAQVSRITL